MAETELTVYESGPAYGEITETGNTTPGTADGHKYLNTGYERVRVENTSGVATADVTFSEQAAPPYISDQTETIPISTVKWFGPFPLEFEDTAKNVHITFESGKESDLNTFVMRCWPRN